MKIQNILVFTGYVESSSWSALPFHHHVGFDSVEEALQHLGQCILTAFRVEDEHTYFPPCCRESMDKMFDHCSKCGQYVKKRIIGRERLAQAIVDMRTGNTDSIGGEFWEIITGNGWNIWGQDTRGNSFDNVVILGEHGEYTLADAAFGRIFDNGPQDPEDYNFDESWKKIPEQERRDSLDRFLIDYPDGAKLFLDD